MDATYCLQLLLLFSSVLATATKGKSQSSEKEKEVSEFCSSESFDVRCMDNEAILIQSALYGRMQAGRCISSDYAHSIGCYADVLQYMDTQCSGRQECKILIATLEAVAQPCSKDFKSYLQAKYICVEVAAVRPESCRTEDVQPLPTPAGIIAAGTIDHGPTNVHCRWTVTAKPGQHISLKLLTFDLLSFEDWIYSDDANSQQQQQALCTVDMSVSERQSDRSQVDICNIKTREKEIYKSRTNSIVIEIRTYQPQYRTPRFMIEYRAVGCPDLQAEGNTWVSRSGDHVFVRCNETNETWFLTCKGQRWIGEVGNCTTYRNYEKVLGAHGPFHKGWIVFAIIIGIVLGLLVGTSLLTIALMWRKRHRYDNSPRMSIEDGSGNCTETEISRIPAYLHTEKAIGDVSEYTHVWEIHPPMICQDTGHVPHHVHTCKMAEMERIRRGSKDGAAEPIYASRGGGDSAYGSRISTTGPNSEEKPIFISRNMPLYFDMENTLPHNNSLPRSTNT